MPSLGRTRSGTRLDCWTGTPGTPADPTALSYVIYDVSTDAKLISPEQVYPVTVGDRQAVDLVADKLGVGHFKANWLPVDVGTTLAPRGRHRINWQFTVGGVVYECNEEFDVTSVPAHWGYMLISDARAEGLTTTEASDQRLASVITLATKMIEKHCSRWFEPRSMTITLDAHNDRVLNLPHPIVAVTSVKIDTTEVELDDLVIYNRHLVEGLTVPDDRQIPKLEWSISDLSYGGAWLFSPGLWTEGQRIVEIVGVFGYTDPDDSVVGALPDLIRHACKLLVMREFPTMSGDADTREDRQQRWRVVGDRTRDQSITMSPRTAGASSTSITGDPDVDRLLEDFRRLPRVAAV